MWDQSDQQQPPENFQNEFEDQKKNTDRECTNVSSMVVCIIILIVTLGLIGYCAKTADFNQLKVPKDDCGNICGQLNDKNFIPKSLNCTAQDMRNYPKLLMSLKKGNKCVENCPKGYEETFNRCIKHGRKMEGAKKVLDAFLSSWYLILLVCFIAFVFSYICLLLYRYFAKQVIWIMNIGFIIFVLGIGTYFLMQKNTKNTIIFYLFGVILIVILILYRKQIELVAGIFKESSKSLMDVPAITFEPILTFIALLITFFIFTCFLIVIEISRNTQAIPGSKKGIYIAAHIFNSVTFIWFTQFIFGCQHYIIAGTVGRWYFSRNKNKLGSPIWDSFVNLTSFHLGSVCLGSMLITIMKIIKMIVKAIKKSTEDSESFLAQCCACLCSYIVDLIDQLVEYLVRNAYIIIALDGTPFVDSGKRAFHLLKDNLEQCYSVNQFGDIVLSVSKFLIVLIAGAVAYVAMKEPGLDDPMLMPVVVSAIFAFFIAHCFITVFEMTVDTIFICYCIDIEENDGDSRPFYMSDKLKNIMMNLREGEGEYEEPDNDTATQMQPQYNQQPIMQQPSYPDTQQAQVYPQFPYAYPQGATGYENSGQQPGYPQQGPYPYPSQQPYFDPNMQQAYPNPYNYGQNVNTSQFGQYPGQQPYPQQQSPYPQYPPNYGPGYQQ